MFDKDLAIKSSKDTPLYFTYLLGLTRYRIDVPDGEYELQLLFAEPDAKPGERVFSVSVNGRDFAKNLDLAGNYGLARAATISGTATAAGGGGLDIRFTASKGKAILNAIRVRKK
jgi:beta-galactosidase